MPVNRRYPLAELLSACRSFPLPQHRRITFAYVMFRRPQRLPGPGPATGPAPERLPGQDQSHPLQCPPRPALPPSAGGTGPGVPGRSCEPPIMRYSSGRVGARRSARPAANWQGCGPDRLQQPKALVATGFIACARPEKGKGGSRTALERIPHHLLGRPLRPTSFQMPLPRNSLFG